MSDAVKEIKDAVAVYEKGARAFEEYKTSIAPALEKAGAFDPATFDKIQKDIAAAVAISQKAEAAAQALDDEKKAIEAKFEAFEKEHKLLEAALNRPISVSPAEQKSEAEVFRTKSHKVFSEFVRRGGNPERGFIEFLEKGGEPKAEALKAMSVNSDPDGGYLVVPSLGGTIETYVRETSPMRQLASVETISSDALEYILDNDEADAGWVTETQPRPETGTPKLGKLLIPVHEIYAQPKATQKLIDDAAIDVEAWLGRKVAQKFTRMENTAFMIGDGIGKPRGLLAQPAGTDPALGQVEQVVSGSASAFAYDGLVNLQTALKEEYQKNASWLVNRLGFGALLLIKDLNGTPIFNMAYDTRVGLQRDILGAPLYFASDMPAVAAGAIAAAYGDFKRAYQIVDRIGIRVLRDPFTDKPFVKFYTTKRVGGAPVNFEAFKLLKVSA